MRALSLLGYGASDSLTYIGTCLCALNTTINTIAPMLHLIAAGTKLAARPVVGLGGLAIRASSCSASSSPNYTYSLAVQTYPSEPMPTYYSTTTTMSSSFVVPVNGLHDSPRCATGKNCYSSLQEPSESEDYDIDLPKSRTREQHDSHDSRYSGLEEDDI
mmetsp:Transcript_21071/g.49468  ORF Transcript_21071/g.49468 Transcript_21071/m.49468 type:complete len:160 (-) Transcript_21071:1404-1883(-)